MIGSLDYRKKGHPAARKCSALHCFLTLEKIENVGWEVLPHPPYSPDLAPSDYRFYGFVKSQMRGQRYVTNDASMSSGSRSGVLPQGNTQTSRTLRKMSTEKRGLCRKISRCLWIKMMYFIFYIEINFNL